MNERSIAGWMIASARARLKTEVRFEGRSSFCQFASGAQSASGVGCGDDELVGWPWRAPGGLCVRRPAMDTVMRMPR